MNRGKTTHIYHEANVYELPPALDRVAFLLDLGLAVIDVCQKHGVHRTKSVATFHPSGLLPSDVPADPTDSRG